jgi:S-ribosylhomocysteine lyase LuxS involved in autoinducer biosynthesis
MVSPLDETTTIRICLPNTNTSQTNAIDSLNYLMRKVLKNRGAFSEREFILI